jgi:hypothetical protein
MRTTLGVAVVTAGLLGSCSGDTGRFFIVQNQVPTAGCVVGTNKNLYQGEGVLDVSLVGGGSFAYQLFPLLQNDYPTAGSANAPEPNRMFVRAFRVRVEAADGAPPKVAETIDRLANSDLTRSLVEFQQPWAATIEPGGGLLAAAVGVIPSELARQVRNTRALESATFAPVNVRVKAVGQRRDGDVESQEFVFPIRLCDGCLVTNRTACPFAAKNLGNACNVAQDALVDCCAAGTELVCPAPAAK